MQTQTLLPAGTLTQGQRQKLQQEHRQTQARQEGEGSQVPPADQGSLPSGGIETLLQGGQLGPQRHGFIAS